MIMGSVLLIMILLLISLITLNIDNIKQNLETVIPFSDNQKVIKDEESGVTILPKSQNGFKSFSGNSQ